MCLSMKLITCYPSISFAQTTNKPGKLDHAIMDRQINSPYYKQENHKKQGSDKLKMDNKKSGEYPLFERTWFFNTRLH